MTNWLEKWVGWQNELLGKSKEIKKITPTPFSQHEDTDENILGAYGYVVLATYWHMTDKIAFFVILLD